MLSSAISRRLLYRGISRYTTRAYSIAPAPPSPSATPPTPPLLSKLRSDLKDAMKAKDQAKLAALRNLLSAINSSLKSPTPPTTNAALLTIVNKQLSTCRTSIAEFSAASRSDLVEKEQAQVDVLQAYADSVETVAREEIRTIAEECLGKMNEAGGKVEMGTMMRTVVKALEEGGKGFVKADVAGVVKEVMGGKS